MSFHHTSRRLSELLVRRFSEPELRRAVHRRFPELEDDLPCRPVSLRALADALVELAERRGCLTELALELLVAWSRRVRPIRVAFCCALAIAGVTLAIRQTMRAPADANDGVRPEGARTRPRADGPATEPFSEPEAPRISASPVAPTNAPRKRRALRVASTKLPPEKPPPELEYQPPDLSHEPRSGEAQCNGGLCVLGADSGRFSKSEEFCVERANGIGVERCIIHGRLIHPATIVKCDLSGDKISLFGSMRWRMCINEP